MGRELAATLQRLRADVLARLVEIRGSIDDIYLRLPEAAVRAQLDVLLEQMIIAIRSDEPAAFDAYVSRWAAVRYGEGFTAESLLHTLAAIGDAVARVAHAQLEAGPELVAVARTAIDTAAGAARLIAVGLADELAARTAQLAALRESDL